MTQKMWSAIPKVLALAALVAPVLGFCGSHTHLSTRAEEGEVKVNTFGYTGELVWTENWVALDATANALCAAGTRQSPMNMVDGQFHTVDSSEIVLEIPDQPEGIIFENLGTTVEGVLEGKGGRLELGGVEYDMKQFNIHHPSEHLDNGTSVEMEVHNVFESADGQLAVIGVYVEVDMGTTVTVAARRRRNLLSEAVEGKNFEIMATTAVPDTESISSNLLETVFQSIEEIATPGASVTTAPLVFSEYVAALKAGSFQTYAGSLTTPPCSEGVNWLVATRKLKISPATLHRVVNVVKFNARFTQNSLGSPNILSFAAQAALASPPTTA
ncbi:putative Alpha carbonic anhydrase [Seiridium cardinale]|uniref:carbonic anhydrase n=1 Tax=Seiridium cardinale TaxID=138064 RepID=A0ABR2XN00_9PEZI